MRRISVGVITKSNIASSEATHRVHTRRFHSKLVDSRRRHIVHCLLTVHTLKDFSPCHRRRRLIGHDLRHSSIVCSTHYLEAKSDCSSVLPCKHDYKSHRNCWRCFTVALTPSHQREHVNTQTLLLYSTSFGHIAITQNCFEYVCFRIAVPDALFYLCWPLLSLSSDNLKPNPAKTVDLTS